MLGLSRFYSPSELSLNARSCECIEALFLVCSAAFVWGPLDPGCRRRLQLRLGFSFFLSVSLSMSGLGHPRRYCLCTGQWKRLRKEIRYVQDPSDGRPE